MNKIEAIEKMNYFGSQRIPFYFLIDFNMQNIKLYDYNEYENSDFKFLVNNDRSSEKPSKKIDLKKNPIDFETYKKAYEYSLSQLKFGNSYLLNLTFPSQIYTKLTLNDIYNNSKAKYKVLLKDEFVCFSPETFIKIEDGKIYSYPMKGTIDAAIPNAENIILNDLKEIAEHYTIVDLIRNDLSIIAKNVEVTKFRFVEKILTSDKTLFQISSEIKGDLPSNFKENLGDMIFELLPAGSITGAPKKKTIEIIEKSENYERNYYTGIAGYFDGESLDSCVLIRFIEKIGNLLFFKSGGGITTQSDLTSEYEELINKIYVTF